MKPGLAPSLLVMVKVLVGRVSRTVRGSLRILRVSSPVFVRVATTFKF